MNDRCNLRSIVGDDSRLKRFYRFLNPAGLAVGGSISPHWMRDGVSFWYVDGPRHETVILRVDGETGKVAPLFDMAKTREALAAVIGHELPYKGLPFDSFAEIGEGRYQFFFEGTSYVLSTDDYGVETAGSDSAVSNDMRIISNNLGVESADRQVPRPYRRPMWLMEPWLVTEAPSPDRRWFASLKDGNIVLRSPIDERTVPLTTDGTPEFAWDIEAPRMTISAGMELSERLLDPWSPDGQKLFAIKIDRRAVPDAPLIRYLKRDEEYCSFKIQRAGGPIDIAHPHVIDVLAKRVRCFELGDTEDQFFTLLGWLPDGSEVLFTRHSRDFKTVDVLAGNPLDSSVRVLLSESAETFVAIQHDVLYWGDNHATILPDSSGLIWRSSRSGWNHFYLYGLDGTLIRALTQGEFPVIDVAAADMKSGWIYFTAHHDPDRPYDTHLCRVQLTDPKIQRLTALDGQNVVSISPLKKTFTVVNSRPDRPFRTDFHACDGKHLSTVQHADVSALNALGHVPSEEFTVTAADGQTVLWGVMHKPADFDPNKKYPVIDHLYAGPQIAMVSRDFSLGQLSQMCLDRALAQLGYIVISVDGRGTPERSKAFQDVVYGNWGRHEIPDHVATLQQLAKRHSFIDLSRVGVWGHSWGGYFTIRALAQAPELFRVGLASSPAADLYDLFIYEPYLDLPTRAKAAYDYASLYPWAGKITGELMMIAGTADTTCYSTTLEMSYYLIQAGVDHEIVIRPEGYHGYLGGKDEDYFIRKLVKHFESHLKARTVG